jgi:hypothetical protein
MYFKMIDNINKKNGPRNFNRYNVILILIGIFILFFLLAKVPNPEYFLSDPDGGHQLAGAMQILSGEHPFIDFRSSYGPLTFYASTFGQMLSGNRIIGEIILIVAGYLAAYLLLFALFYDVSGKFGISVVYLCLALILMPRFYKYYIVLGPVLTLFSAWKYIDNRSAKSFVFMSFAIVITGLYRFDFGIYTAICGITTIVLINYKQNIREILKPIGIFLLVVVGLASPWLLWVLYKGGLTNYLGDTLSGMLNQSEGLSLPFPRYKFSESVISNTNITFGLFVFYNIIPAASLGALFALKDKLNQNEKYKIVIMIMLAQLTLIQAMHRSDIGHLLQSIPIGFVLLAWLFRVAVKATQKNRKGLAACMVFFIVVVGANVVLSKNLNMLPEKNVKNVFMNLKLLTGNNDEILEYTRISNSENEYVRVNDYIKNNTYKDDSILAIPFLPSFYYFTGRKFGGGQMLLAPGYFSSENDQRKMIDKLVRDNVSLIVEIPDASYDGLENRKIYRFASIVNGYIDTNYRQVSRIGRFVINAKNKNPECKYSKLCE